jgi:opacity protein-like surface antigen
MKFIKYIIICISIVYFATEQKVSAQIFHFKDLKEYVLGFGATNFLGDLGGTPMIGSDSFSMRDLDWPATRPLVYAGYRYRFYDRAAVTGNLTFGYLYGNDQLTDNEFRRFRNAHFRSPIVELSGQGEFLMSRQREGHRYRLKGVQGWKFENIESYVFLGIGLLWFNPQAKYFDGKWYKLQPLGTEGQIVLPHRKPYSRITFTVPIGIGAKYALDKNWSIGLEYGLRKTFTDYIDDVSTVYFDPEVIKQEQTKEMLGEIAAYFADPSIKDPQDPYYIDLGGNPAGLQRGDPTDKDSYMFLVIKIFYRFRGGFLDIPKFW